MFTLTDILNGYSTDKNQFHTYAQVYEQFFPKVRERVTSVLEIGVYNGESLRAWRDFFPNAQIYGIDDNPTCLVDELRITSRLGDQNDPLFLTYIGMKHGPFDIIIDDGSHVISHQLTSFLYLWPFLKADGLSLYFIEDIQQEDYLETYRHLGFDIYDLRVPGSPDDNIMVVKRRENVNYGFKCPEDGCKARAFFSFLVPMNARPKCPTHSIHYVPDLNWPEGVQVEEVTYTPAEAQELLDNAFESSFEGCDERLIAHYASLMTSGQWVSATKDMGGAHYPIYFRDDRVLLGVQRLQACVRSGVPLQTVVVKTYGYF